MIHVQRYILPERVEKTYTLKRRGIIEFALTPRPPHSCGQLNDVCGSRNWNRLGDTVFLPPGVTFHVRVPKGRYETFACRFPARALAEAGCPEHWEEEALSGALRLSSPGLRLNVSVLLNRLREPFFCKPTYVEAATTLLLYEALRHMSNAQALDTRKIGGLAPWRLRFIEDRINSEDVELPKISELAKLCGLTSRHLMRAYRHQTGFTIGDRIRHMGIERAKRRLRADDASIKQIALDLGFASTSSFGTAFRREVGMSPSEFRLSGGLHN